MEELVDEFVTFFFAGQETTTIALSFALIGLALNPNELKK
jgi:cytochrome P450